MKRNIPLKLRIAATTVILTILFVSTAVAYNGVSASVFSGIAPGLSSAISAWLSPPAPVVAAASVSTDKDDYVPGQTVIISGSGFLAGEKVQLQIVHIAPSGFKMESALEADHSGHEPWEVTADSSGNISSSWLVQEDSRGQTLLLTALGLTSGNTASATFTDAGVSFLQCANNQGANPLGECNWIGSILQQSNSVFFEGMSTLQRIIFTDVNPAGTGGNNHVLNFKHQATKGVSIHAYDFLTSWEQAFRVAQDKGVPFLDITQTYVVAAADEDAGSTPPYTHTMTNVEACENFNGTANTACEGLRDNRPSVGPLPDANNRFFCDVQIPAELGNTLLLNATETRAAAYEAVYGKRYVRIYGDQLFNSCSIAVDAVTLEDTDEVYIGYNLNWNSTSTNVLIELAGHLAEGTAAASGWGVGFGSSSINGGPYHFKFNSLDGDATGSKDNQIKGADILLQPKGAVTIQKQTVGGTGSFNYTASGTGVPAQVPAAFPLDTGVNNPASVAYADIPAGNLTVIESGPPAGWDLTNIVCTGDSDSGSIIGDGAGPNVEDGDFDAGDNQVVIDIDDLENITCTFTNEADAVIIVDKVTNPNPDPSNTAFDFTTSYGAPFSLTNSGAPNNSGDLAPAGTYDVAEAAEAGWDLTSIACVSSIGDATDTDGVDLDLDAGETITCTFNNEADAVIIVDKVTNPNPDPSNTAFDFTTSYGAPFSLTNSGAPNNSGDLAPAGTYDVAEAAEAGWDLTSIACVSSIGDATDTDGVDLDLDAGETITCTFTNEADAVIIVDKVTNPNPDPSNTAFDFTTSYGAPFSLTNSGAPNNSGDLAPAGTYDVAEAAEAGWDLTSIACVSSIGDATDTDGVDLDLDAGETITCTFNNEADAVIIVDKVTNPNPDPSNTAFDFTTSYGAPFSLTNSGAPNNSGDLAPAGTYDVAEAAEAGWDLTSIACVSSIGDATDTDGVDLDLDAGETITCTFTNEADAVIIVDKVTNPNPDPSNTAFDFTTSYGAPFSLTNSGAPNNSGDLAPAGTYDVAEAAEAGWDLTSIACVSSIGDATDTDGVDLDLDAGETITCTFNNEADAVIIVDKVTNPNPDPSNTAFDFTTSYGAPFSLTNSGAPNNSGDLAPAGTYDVAEAAEAGWDLTSIACVSSIGDATDTDGVDLDLDAGETITCTFNNTKRGHLELTKTVNGFIRPDLNIQFSLYLNGDPAAVPPDLTIPPDVLKQSLNIFGDADGKLVFDEVAPGSYTACEFFVPSGYTDTWLVNGVPTASYNPGANDLPFPEDLGTRCVDFTIGAGDTVDISVTNTSPLGDARTIGYWKNWSSCTGGNQDPVLDYVLDSFGGAHVDILNLPDYPLLEPYAGVDIGLFYVDTCSEAVAVLDKRFYAPVGRGAKKASNPAVNMAAQYLAVLLNIQADADPLCLLEDPDGLGPAVSLIAEAQALLVAVGYDGNSTSTITTAQKNRLLELNGIFDAYNNNTFVCAP